MTEPVSDRNDSAIDNVTSIETNKEICRIFVSRKDDDKDILGARNKNREDLNTYAAGRLEFFDAENIEPGDNWRREIQEELKRADILLLILTRRSKKVFDWPIFEAGFFKGLGADGRLVCLYPEGEDQPKQIEEHQGVEATEEKLLNLLRKLFTDRKFTNTRTALNAKVFENKSATAAMEDIAKKFCAEINGFTDEELTDVSYSNPYIQLMLSQRKSKLERDTEITSNKNSMAAIFQLDEFRPGGQLWNWGDLADAIESGDAGLAEYNSRWMRETESAVEELLRGKADYQRITTRFIGKDNLLLSPEIEIWRKYRSSKMTLDITFSSAQHDMWLKDANPSVALAANLSLAGRVRHDLLDSYRSKLPFWDDGDSGFSDLSQLVDTIEADGFFINWLTRASIREAFEQPDDQKEFKALSDEFGKDIHGRLHEALNSRNVKKLEAALEDWRVNNARFFKVGIPRYTKLLGLNE